MVRLRKASSFIEASWTRASLSSSIEDVSTNDSESNSDSSCCYSRLIGLSLIILAETEFFVGNFFAIALISRLILKRSLILFITLSFVGLRVGVIILSLKLLSKFEFKIGILGLTIVVF